MVARTDSAWSFTYFLQRCCSDVTDHMGSTLCITVYYGSFRGCRRELIKADYLTEKGKCARVVRTCCDAFAAILYAKSVYASAKLIPKEPEEEKKEKDKAKEKKEKKEKKKKENNE